MSKLPLQELLIGIHPVATALGEVPGQLVGIMVAAECRNPRVRALRGLAEQAGVPVEILPRSELDRRSGGGRHQDVIAGFRPANLYAEKDLDRVLDTVEGDPLVLVLDGVQDPHNLGACLRTADAAGVDLVILPRDRAAGLTPTVRRAASGAAETLPILFVPNLARVLKRLRQRGLWLAGSTDRSDSSFFEADLRGPLGLVMGAEGKGMRRLTAELCDYRLCIPMQGTVGSLNVSVATGICLYEILRQRGLS